jgi:hypothetical protein
MDLLKLLKETRASVGQGSSSGRDKMISSTKRKDHTKASKSRVKVYNSITDALKKGYEGQIFSTKNADRLYVITRRKWGKDDEQVVNGRVAKGFSPGSVPSTFKDVKRYAVRTMVRHGKNNSHKFTGNNYWKSKRDG